MFVLLECLIGSFSTGYVHFSILELCLISINNYICTYNTDTYICMHACKKSNVCTDVRMYVCTIQSFHSLELSNNDCNYMTVVFL